MIEIARKPAEFRGAARAAPLHLVLPHLIRIEALEPFLQPLGVPFFGGKVFKTVITKSVRLEESPAYKESIFTFAPDSTGATEYYRLCEEVIDRA